MTPPRVYSGMDNLCPAEQVAAFIKCLCDADDNLNIRYIRPDPADPTKSKARNAFMRAGDIPERLEREILPLNQAGWNVYLGVNPRTVMGDGSDAKSCEKAGGGKCGACAKCVKHAWFLFADADGIPMAVLQQRMQDANIPAPTMIVASGRPDGRHLYWRLEDPITDMKLWRGLMRAIRDALKTDNIGDEPRILRLPGTRNLKPDYGGNARCELVECHPDRVYSKLDFPEPVEEEETKNPGAGHAAKRDDEYGEQPHDLKVKLVKASLDRLKSSRCEDYDPCGAWLGVGMILHAELGDDGLPLWLEWSKGSAKFNEDVCRAKWSTFDANRAKAQRLGSLLKWAAEDSGDDRFIEAIKSAHNRARISEAQSPSFKGGPILIDPKAPLDTALTFLARRCMIDGVPTVRYWRERFMRYDGVQWVAIEDKAVRKSLYDFLAGCVFLNPKDIELPVVPTKGMVDQVYDALVSAVLLPCDQDAPTWTDHRAGDPDPMDALSCGNGILIISERRLTASTPRLFTTNGVPYCYDPADECPQWLRFLDSLWPDDPDAIHLLRQWFGLLLTSITRFQKALMLIGPPRSGKGTISRAATAMLGRNACTSGTLASLREPFGLSGMLDKSAAFYNDCRLGRGEGSSAVIERILSLTGEDILPVNVKHKPIVNARLRSRLTFISNEIPALLDESGAVASRFLLLKLTRSWLGEEDIMLESKIAAERAGILNWALTGLADLLRCGRFIEPASSLQLIEQLQEVSSPVSAFVEARCVVRPGVRSPISTIYAAWVAWCEAEGIREPGDKASFGKSLRACHPSIEKKQGTGGERFYEGVRLRGSDEPKGEETSASTNRHTASTNRQTNRQAASGGASDAAAVESKTLKDAPTNQDQPGPTSCLKSSSPYGCIDDASSDPESSRVINIGTNQLVPVGEADLVGHPDAVALIRSLAVNGNAVRLMGVFEDRIAAGWKVCEALEAVRVEAVCGHGARQGGAG